MRISGLFPLGVGRARCSVEHHLSARAVVRERMPSYSWSSMYFELSMPSGEVLSSRI